MNTDTMNTVSTLKASIGKVSTGRVGTQRATSERPSNLPAREDQVRLRPRRDQHWQAGSVGGTLRAFWVRLRRTCYGLRVRPVGLVQCSGPMLGVCRACKGVCGASCGLCLMYLRPRVHKADYGSRQRASVWRLFRMGVFGSVLAAHQQTRERAKPCIVTSKESND